MLPVELALRFDGLPWRVERNAPYARA